MAKVKILLEPGESQLDADNHLYKALQHHVGGDVHMRESFDDPAMVHVSQRMEDIHSQIYKEMIREIIDALDEEYSDGNE